MSWAAPGVARTLWLALSVVGAWGSGPAVARSDRGAAPPADTLAPVVVTGERDRPALAEDAGIASRLGLSVRETPASIEVLPQSVLQERGVRSVSEAAQAATGVTAGDFPAEPANFSMRGFANSQLNTLYNGIKVGPPNMTSRIMDVGNLARIEFLKGPASLSSGEGAAGGAINFVTRGPHRGPVRHEFHQSAGSFGTLRTGLGSGGTSAIDSLDYRFDLNRSATRGFIDDTAQENWHLSGGLDWYPRPGVKLFGALEYKRDSGSPYWGTPLVPIASPGIQPVAGVISGTYASGFNGTDLGQVTIDRRTLRTNYNVLDHRNRAEEHWLRAGFEWQIDTALTLRTQLHRYAAEREWRNNEITAFNAQTTLVDRERFYVAHDQTVLGGRSELRWDGALAGRPHRMVGAVDWSELDFRRPGAANFPGDSVALVDPQRGSYGLLTTRLQATTIRNLALTAENRLELMPGLALVGGLRSESIALDRQSAGVDGVQRPGFPFSKTWRPTTGRAGMTWALAGGLIAYGQYATGADVAANNIFLLGAAQPLELTRVRSHELGLKHALPGQRAEWTLALYDIVRDNVYAAQGGRALAMAGQQLSRGAELSASFRPSAAWRFWGNIAYNDSRYANYNFAGGSFSGNAPPNAPRIVANAGAARRWIGRWPMELGASVRHVGERFHSDANTVRLSAYTVIDAALTLDVGRQTRLSLRGRNLADRVYAIWADPFYPDQILLGAPRSVELGLAMRF